MIYIHNVDNQCYMPSLKILGFRVLEKIFFLKVFTIYGHGGHLGHVTWIINIHIASNFLRMLHIKFGFDLLSGFRE